MSIYRTRTYIAADFDNDRDAVDQLEKWNNNNNLALTFSNAHDLQCSRDTREALIKSLSAFILGFLCNARNGTTRIASYLRKPMTKQCIKILIKENSMN